MNKRITRIIIHDLRPEEWDIPLRADEVVLSNESPIGQCIGCFGCWIKTPSVCVIKDEFQKLGRMFCLADELVLISKCTYGGLSPFVKNVLDRCIGCMLPFFSIRNGEVHHTLRTDNHLQLTVHFYGGNTEGEQQTAQKLVLANAINLNADQYNVYFHENSQEMGRKVE